MAGMRLNAIRPGDIVRCNEKAVCFTRRSPASGPLARCACSRSSATAATATSRPQEIADHWTHTVARRRADRRPPTQTALDFEHAG
jgi:hypothetical protein